MNLVEVTTLLLFGLQYLKMYDSVSVEELILFVSGVNESFELMIVLCVDHEFTLLLHCLDAIYIIQQD